MTEEELFNYKIAFRDALNEWSAKLYRDDNRANVTFSYAKDQIHRSKAIEEVLNDREGFKASVDKAVAEIARIGPLFWDYDFNGIQDKQNIDTINSAVAWLQKETGQHSLFSHSEFINLNFDKN